MKFKEIQLDNDKVVCAAEYEDGARIIFRWDHYPESPREWDNLGTLCMWHRRYDLPCEGTTRKPDDRDFQDWCAMEQPRKTMSGKEATENVGLEWVMMYGEYTLDNAEKTLSEEWQVRMLHRMINYVNKNYVWSLVGLYDHSGLAFSHVASYNYGDWDSGVVGCHYVSVETLAEEFPKMTKAQRIIAANDHLKAELDTYNMWQSGSVVWFELLDKDGEQIESCGGFITDKLNLDDLLNEVFDHLPSKYREGVTNER